MGKAGDKKGKAGKAERRHERHSAKGKVKCPLGDVLDVSAGGMRVACSGKPALQPGTAAAIKLRTAAGVESVNARCCWVRKTGWIKGHEIGLKFIGITEQQAVRIGKIAKFGFLPEDDRDAGTSDGQSNGDSNGKPAPKITAELDLSPYLKTLELPDDATPEQVRDAHRRLVRTCHPDVCDKPESQERFVELQQAYDMLRTHLRQRKDDEAKAA